MIKIATWNVNSIRIRLNLLDKLVKDENPDIICLQEVKAKEEDFPFNEIKELGFDNIALYSIPGYNGVAILSKLPFVNEQKYTRVGKDDARHISIELNNGLELHNIYVPAGGDIPDTDSNPSFVHKLNFIDEMKEFFNKTQNKKRIICGDFNVAPLNNDVWNHKAMLKIISHTPVETEKVTDWFNCGNFIDVVRSIYPEPEKIYSWWSYRNPNWQTNNKGRRLDHIWCSPDIMPKISKVKILKDFRLQERPSDHVPIVAELEI